MENPHSYVIDANYIQNKPTNQFYIAIKVCKASRCYLCATNQVTIHSSLLGIMFKHK